ncbi:MAG: hypothetical protein UX62_C0054G0011 [Microgenomates group bacterium GW2011_GWA2_46_7]|nr:MAG: hypothetical protein UX62_C0054G0011 [Microgenomates group bacterium GW2011_GWA2_46_7]
MTTVVNNPAPTDNSSGNGLVILSIVLLIMAAIFVYYGIPALRRMGAPQISVPTQIVVPDKVDVNINQTP